MRLSVAHCRPWALSHESGESSAPSKPNSQVHVLVSIGADHSYTMDAGSASAVAV